MTTTTTRANKYSYLNVIQQHYGQGWEDVSEYEADSQGRSIGEALHSGKFHTNAKTGRTRELTLLSHDLKEYQLTGYPTRVIFRKELKRPEYEVKTETKGVLTFDELPKGTYFAMGNCGNDPQSKAGEAFYFTFDNGTCLIPIIDKATGLQVCQPERAGTEIN